MEVVKYLVEAGAKVEATDGGGWTPLHHACSGGHMEVVKYLVEEANASLGAVTNSNQTPLDLARANDHSAVTEYLLSRTPHYY